MVKLRRSESIVVWVLILPLAIAMNALLFLGFDLRTALRDPISWVLFAVWLVVALRIFRQARRDALS